VRMDTCSDCYPRELLVRRVGDETVEVGVLSVHDAEVIEEYDDEWSQTNVWSVVELVDRCVPAEPGGTKYTYEFVREVAWEEQVRHDDSIRVQQNGFCQTEAGQEAGCAASISGSRVASATPMVLGLLMVLVGVATMRMTRREE